MTAVVPSRLPMRLSYLRDPHDKKNRYRNRDTGFSSDFRLTTSVFLLHHNLLGLDVVAVDEAEHIDSGGGVDLGGGVAVDGLGAEHAAGHIDNLQGGFTFVVDGPIVTIEEGEVVGVLLVDAAVGAEHEAEAAGVVGDLSLEAVARVGNQVDVGAGHVVDEVEVLHLNVFGVDAKGVGAVVFSLEADRHLTFGFAADDCVFAVVLSDADLGAVLTELELGQLTAFTEADDGAVDDIATVAGDVHDDFFTSGVWSCGADFQFLTILVSDDEEALHDSDFVAFASDDFTTVL